MIQQWRELQKEVKRQCLFMISNSKASRRWCLAICDNGKSHFLPEERIFWKKMSSIRLRQWGCKRL